MDRIAFYRNLVAKLRAKKAHALALAHINCGLFVDDPDAKADHFERALKLLVPAAIAKGGTSPHVEDARAVNRELRANLIALRRFEAEAKAQAAAKESAA